MKNLSVACPRGYYKGYGYPYAYIFNLRAAQGKQRTYALWNAAADSVARHTVGDPAALLMDS